MQRYFGFPSLDALARGGWLAVLVDGASLLGVAELIAGCRRVRQGLGATSRVRYKVLDCELERASLCPDHPSSEVVPEGYG